MRYRSNLAQIIGNPPRPSLRQLAEEIDHNRESLRLFYNDEMKAYPADMLAKLSTRLGVPIEELLVLDDKKDA